MAVFQKISGTQVGSFLLGILGVKLKNNAGNLEVRNNLDTGFADAAVKDITLKNNTTGFGVALTTSGTQAADYTLTLPVDDGSPAQVLTTDGSGVLSWTSVSTSSNWTVDSTSLAFGDGATVSMFTLPANAVIDKVTVIVDTIFNGTPTLSVGIAGNASKYFGSGDSLLNLADRFDVWNQLAPVGAPEALEISYSAGGATAGAARVLVTYAQPV